MIPRFGGFFLTRMICVHCISSSLLAKNVNHTSEGSQRTGWDRIYLLALGLDNQPKNGRGKGYTNPRNNLSEQDLSCLSTHSVLIPNSIGLALCRSKHLDHLRTFGIVLWSEMICIGFLCEDGNIVACTDSLVVEIICAPESNVSLKGAFLIPHSFPPVVHHILIACTDDG